MTLGHKNRHFIDNLKRLWHIRPFSETLMPQVVSQVRQKHLIEFDNGSFDAWCIFLTRPGTPRYAPKDSEYFTFFRQMGELMGSQKVYDDFLIIYNLTRKEIDAEVVKLIGYLSNFYGIYAEEAEIWLTVIYAGMVAEENKENVRLGKRLKRLGMHQVLIEGLAPQLAADYSRGKKWRELSLEMKARGF